MPIRFFTISDLFFILNVKVAFQDYNCCDELVSIIARPFRVIGKFAPETERT